MRSISALLVTAVFVASCGSTQATNVTVAEHAEYQITTSIELVRVGPAELALTATYVPDAERIHVHDKDLPDDGIDGFGRPTEFDVVAGDLVATGPVTADVSPIMLSVPATDAPIPVYPDGPVTLTVPVAVDADVGVGEQIDVEVSISYMACTSDGGCSRPVSDQRLSGTVRLPE